MVNFSVSLFTQFTNQVALKKTAIQIGMFNSLNFPLVVSALISFRKFQDIMTKKKPANHTICRLFCFTSNEGTIRPIQNLI